MTIADRSGFARLACVAATLLWAANAGPAAAQEGPPPPSSIGVCPEIEEDGLLCSADLLSGNCADFVVAADRLGALYRSELAKLPDAQASLMTTTWWGCGPGTLGDITALLVRIGSPRALAVLQTQPYASLVVAASPPPAPAAGISRSAAGLRRALEPAAAQRVHRRAAASRARREPERLRALPVARGRGAAR